MSYTPSQARPLLDGDEYEVFRTSFEPALDELSVIDLKLAVRRCRSARDKFRDLQRRQETEALEVAEARGAALDVDDRAAEKAALLDEALARYEERLTALE